MKKILFIIFVSQTMCIMANSQSAPFERIVDDLFFRIETYATDSITSSFLKKHLPFLLEKPSQGQWSVRVGIDENYVDKSYIIGYTLKLKKHPFFNFCTTSCSLSIATKVEDGIFQSVYSRKVTLTFREKSFFDYAYNELMALLQANATHVFLSPIKPLNIIGFENANSKEININEIQLDWRFDALSNEYILDMQTYIDTNYYKVRKTLSR